MILYGLRLLVALLTFVGGVAATRLFNSETPQRRESVSVESAQVRVPVIASQDGGRASSSCPSNRPGFVYQGGTLNHKSVAKPAPVYPPAARDAGVEGIVSVRVLVDEGGRVLTADAMSGPELLREAALDAARRTRFTPTLVSGQPVRVSGVVTYNFVLN